MEEDGGTQERERDLFNQRLTSQLGARAVLAGPAQPAVPLPRPQQHQRQLAKAHPTRVNGQPKPYSLRPVGVQSRRQHHLQSLPA